MPLSRREAALRTTSPAFGAEIGVAPVHAYFALGLPGAVGLVLIDDEAYKPLSRFSWAVGAGIRPAPTSGWWADLNYSRTTYDYYQDPGPYGPFSNRGLIYTLTLTAGWRFAFANHLFADLGVGGGLKHRADKGLANDFGPRPVQTKVTFLPDVTIGVGAAL